MKRAFLSVMVLVMVFVGSFMFVGCKKPADKGNKILSYSVQYVGDEFEYVGTKLTTTYCAKNLSVSKDDFKISVKYEDNTEKVISATEMEKVVMESSIPEKNITNAGSYKVVLTYNKVPMTIDIEVEKATIVDPYLGWNYNTPFQYTGSEKSITLLNVSNKIKNVQYTGNTATERGVYTATATFIVSSNYKDLPPITLTWEIQ